MARCGCWRAKPKFNTGGVSLSELHHLLIQLTAFSSDLVATVKGPRKNPGSDEERKTFENALREYADNEIQNHTAHFVVPPLQPQTYFYKQTGVVSSLATAPFTSALASRSTSRSSGTDSLPITPANELPASPNRTDAQPASSANISASQISLVSLGMPLAFPDFSVTDDTETCLLHTEQRVDLYPLSHHRHQTAFRTTPGVGPQDKSFPEVFIEELFEEGDTAKRLAELQRRSPKKRKISSRP